MVVVNTDTFESVRSVFYLAGASCPCDCIPTLQRRSIKRAGILDTFTDVVITLISCLYFFEFRFV